MKRKPLLLIIGLCLLLSAGCVRRRMTVRSSPPGALVYVDDQEIGRTPVSTNFTYYGTRKIRLVRPGYETLSVLEKIAPPWYQIPPLDFISENLYPREIRDERILEFELEPQRVVPKEELLGRGDELRSAAMAGYAVPAGPRAAGENRDAEFPENRSIPPPFFPAP